MNAKIFKDHLFLNIWEYHVNYEVFSDHYNVAMSMGEHFPWDPEEAQYRQIELLLDQLKNNFAFQDSFNVVASKLTNEERSVIAPFVSWFEYTNGLSFMEMYIKGNHEEGLQIAPLLALVEYVSKLGPFNLLEDPEPINKGLRIIKDVINNFTSSASSLMKRRDKKPLISLDDEYDIQDLLHVMLRPHFFDIRSETVVDGNVDRKFLKIDFLLSKDKIAIECKFNRNKNFDQLKKQIHEDIMVYSKHPDCRTLVFFIYDKDLLIPNADLLEQNFSDIITIGNNRTDVILFIRPKN